MAQLASDSDLLRVGFVATRDTAAVLCWGTHGSTYRKEGKEMGEGWANGNSFGNSAASLGGAETTLPNIVSDIMTVVRMPKDW